MKGLYLKQCQAALAIGKTVAQFQTTRKKLRMIQDGKDKKYFIPASKLTTYYKKFYKDQIKDFKEIQQELQAESEVDPVLAEISENSDFEGGLLNDKLKQTRIKKINAEIDYLNQKIQSRKRELFSDWSERFFNVFSINFSKFKNNLIELHLDDKQLSVLNESLDCAIQGMEKSLDQILNDFIMQDNENEEE